MVRRQGKEEGIDDGKIEEMNVVRRSARLLAHLADGLLNVGEEIQNVSVGVYLDRLGLFSFMSRWAVDLYRASRWSSFGYLIPRARVEHNSSRNVLE